MIEGLDYGLTAGAETAAADGIERIAFDLLDRGYALENLLTFDFNRSLRAHDAYDCAATGRAFGADGGVPALFTDRNIVFGDEERDERVIAAASGCGCACCADADDFEEISTVH